MAPARSAVLSLRRLIATLDERSTRLLVTAAATYLGRFGSGIAVLVTIPMARATLAPDMFGVWMMLSSLLGFFGFADLGIGNGVLNRVIAANATGNRAELRRTIVAGYACTFTMGILIALLWAAWVHVADRPTAIAGKLPASVDAEVLGAFTIFILLLAVNLSASLIQKVQLGSQQGHWVGGTQFVAALCTLIAVPLALHYRAGLTALVLGSLGMQVAANLVSTVLWLRRSALFAAGVEATSVTRERVVVLLRTGILFFGLQLAVAFAYQSDAIVLTQVIGQRAYGDFAVVQKLFLFVSLILSSGLAGLWPAFGDAIARGDMRWARRILGRSLAIAGTFALAAAAALILAMPSLTRHWLHVDVSPPLALTMALGAWTVVDAMGAVSGAFMNGANVLRAQVIFAVTMATLAFAGKWMLTPILGAPGAVLATLLAYGVTSFPGQVFIFKRIFAARQEQP
ncbi:MAG: hypothetical protein M3N82_00695 [Pseudomonadota bacterium]|nr:hypothetical protein [Pseudomonadota bacterium]